MQDINRKQGSGLHFPKAISEQSKDLLRRMLTKNTKDRIDWSELFKHPLFQNTVSQAIAKNNDKGNENEKYEDIRSTIIAQKADDEFSKNKLKNFEAINNFDPSIRNIQVPLASPYEVNEQQIDEESFKLLFKDPILQEMFYRYCHEKNKIQFMIIVVRYINFMIRQSEYKHFIP